ncbi:MAG: serine--tRNA ligase, partial [Planctomycetota bacterium]|nr:serine--tRNA ligase [Planctomycetota bacterium]
MLDVGIFRRDPRVVKDALRKRNLPDDGSVERIVKMDEKRRSLTSETDELRRRRKELSEKIGELRKIGKDSEEMVREVHALKEDLEKKEEELRRLETDIEALILRIPNIPDEEVPEGVTKEENKVVREWGERRDFKFKVKPHYEVGERLGILDMGRGATIAGSHFPLFLGAGASLCRALI